MIIVTISTAPSVHPISRRELPRIWGPSTSRPRPFERYLTMKIVSGTATTAKTNAPTATSSQ